MRDLNLFAVDFATQESSSDTSELVQSGPTRSFAFRISGRNSRWIRDCGNAVFKRAKWSRTLSADSLQQICCIEPLAIVWVAICERNDAVLVDNIDGWNGERMVSLARCLLKVDAESFVLANR